MEFSAEADGVRERKKRETRRQLHGSAIELVVERGLGGVTAEDIARDAGVSPRTFFNYFPTKEAALTGFPENLAERVGAALARRPADEELWPTSRWLAHRLAELSLSDEELWHARRRLVAARPETAHLTLSGQRALEGAVVRALVARAEAVGEASPAWRPLLLATSVLDALRIATQLSTDPADVLPQLTEVLDALEPALRRA